MTVLIAGLLVVAPAQGETSPRYDRLWSELSSEEKQWARQTSDCESGGDRNIHSSGGDYHGAFQFSLPTWESGPRSPGGDPHTYSWRTQAVVAVHLRNRDGGSTHWPNCG